jgi:hypothetical protein
MFTGLRAITCANTLISHLQIHQPFAFAECFMIHAMMLRDQSYLKVEVLTMVLIGLDLIK